MDGGTTFTSLTRRRSKAIDRQSLLDGLSDAVAVVDARGRLRLANEQFRALLGLPVMYSVRGRMLARVFRAATSLSQVAREKLLVACEAAFLGREAPGQAKAAGFSFEARPVGGGCWRLTLAADVASGATFDMLTGLADRQTFDIRLRQACVPCVAGQGAAGACLLLLDLDRFKNVNDTLGHPAGDALLRAVADRLRGGIRAGDLVARLGGDEFGILLPNGATIEEATHLGGRLVDVIGRPYLVAGHSASVGASIGIAFAGAEASDADTLVRYADLALYEAKQGGRGTWRTFAPHMHARAEARRTLETELRRAVALRQFALHYQPQFSMRDQCLTGFEALIRWPHPQKGLIPPGDFIPLAEELGLIGVIGNWALRTACAEAMRWPRELSVAVNVSPLQFERGDLLLAGVRDALENSGLPGHRLEVEITESSLLNDEQATLTTLRALRDLGVRVAMDDFGTGYSSLSQLRAFPFDKIKIDRSFVRDLGSDADASAIIRSINSLGSNLGMKTIAEGVETDAQAESLLRDGCSDIQGYLVSRPVPPDAIQSLISRLHATPRETPR